MLYNTLKVLFLEMIECISFITPTGISRKPNIPKKKNICKLLIFHSSIGALWSETSNKLVFRWFSHQYWRTSYLMYFYYTAAIRFAKHYSYL